MNVTEANATQLLLRYLLGHYSPEGRLYTPAEAQHAWFYLASRSSQALSAGLSGAELVRHWPKRREVASEARHAELLDAVEKVLTLSREREDGLIPFIDSLSELRRLYTKERPQ